MTIGLHDLCLKKSSVQEADGTSVSDLTGRCGPKREGFEGRQAFGRVGVVCSFLVLIFLFPAKAHSQSTTQGLTPAEYVNLLLGEGIEVSNVQFQGGSDQIGMLAGAEAVLGLDGGVMLSTDHAGICAGSGGSACTNCLGLGASADLLSIANSVPPLIGQSFSVSSVHDVAMLSFDFVASGDSIQFDYIFGSDEYLEWVNFPFNDVFAFFLSGPGIAGPFSSPSGFPNGSINPI